MEYGLIGAHLGHSYSPEIHAKIAPYRYELRELPPGEVGAFLRAREFRAINVTIPYKQTVIPYLDEVDAAAARIGAVNTIVNRDGRLCGCNTDFAGLRALLARTGVDLGGKKVLILGTGGTSKTAHAVAESLGAAEILHVSRRPGPGAVTYDEARTRHTDAQVILNTTPVGMYPAAEGLPIELDAFPALSGAADVIYHPLRTNFVLDAQARGIPAAGGLYMLAAQAVFAAALFRNVAANEARIERVYRAVLAEKETISLIGMPSCGKTTVGARLGELTGRRVIDTDAVITARIGMPIADFFAKNGEKAFRAIEREVVAEAAGESGCIVATGGGAVLDAANVRALRRAGRVFFLDRPLDLLTATADRPLSAGRAALEARYRERYQLYCAAADVRVDGGGTAEDSAQRIRKELST
jgi:shikimate dehydrogenase